MDKVSIIVPVYNVESYLDQCISSILDQTYKDIELILVDDGSTDNSSHICVEWKAHDNRIHYIRQENRGVASARNKGISTSSGDYIVFCDSDDMLADVFVEKMLETAQKYDVDIVSCDYTKDEEEWNALQNKNYHTLHIETFSGRNALANDKVCQVLWGKLYNKRLFDDIQISELKLHEDVATVYRLYYKAKKVASIQGKLYFNLIRAGSLSRQGIYSDEQVGRLRVLDDKMTFFREKKDEVLYNKAVKEYVIGLLSFMEGYRLSGEKKKYQELWKEYKMIYPEIIRQNGTFSFHMSLRVAKICPLLWTKMNHVRDFIRK